MSANCQQSRNDFANVALNREVTQFQAVRISDKNINHTIQWLTKYIYHKNGGYKDINNKYT